MLRPAAGALMAFICAVVMRGISKPCVVELRSRMALLSGVVVPMATCAWPLWQEIRKRIKHNVKVRVFFILVSGFIRWKK
jgi:hypothetical protein